MTQKLTIVPYDKKLILTGWKAIAETCGGISMYQIKSRAKRYKMPYVRLCGKVTIPRVVLLARSMPRRALNANDSTSC